VSTGWLNYNWDNFKSKGTIYDVFFNRHNSPSGDMEEPKFVVSSENQVW